MRRRAQSLQVATSRPVARPSSKIEPMKQRRAGERIAAQAAATKSVNPLVVSMNLLVLLGVIINVSAAASNAAQAAGLDAGAQAEKSASETLVRTNWRSATVPHSTGNENLTSGSSMIKRRMPKRHHVGASATRPGKRDALLLLSSRGELAKQREVADVSLEQNPFDNADEPQSLGTAQSNDLSPADFETDDMAEPAPNIGWFVPHLNRFVESPATRLEALNWAPDDLRVIDSPATAGREQDMSSLSVSSNQQATRQLTSDGHQQQPRQPFELAEHRGSHQHLQQGPQLAVVVASHDPVRLAHEAPQTNQSKDPASKQLASNQDEPEAQVGSRTATNQTSARAKMPSDRSGQGTLRAGTKRKKGLLQARDASCSLLDVYQINSWYCENWNMTELPDELNPPPGNLRLVNVGVRVLRRSAIERYRKTLHDFSIEHAPFLNELESNVFANMSRLRVIYIFQVPNLVDFNFAIVGRNPELTIIRIQQTGLRSWPDLGLFMQERLLTSVDLNDNQIETLGSKPINIRAELLNLEFNRLTSIGEHTFNGSEIGTLSLASNRRLSFIHRNAFANLKNLIKLDLSSTSVAQLPTIGFDHLRALIIRDNYALRRIPSIYVFPVLEEARLTYSYHCCSFANPQKHDPNAYLEHVRIQNAINEYCSRRIGDQNDLKVTQADGAAANGEPAPKLEQRRDLNGASSSFAPGDSSMISQMAPSWSQNSDFEGSFGLPQQAESIDVRSVTTSTAFSNQSGEDSRESTITPTSTYYSGSSFEGDMSGGPIEVMANQSSAGDKVPLLQNVECGELVLKSSLGQAIICTPEPDAFNPCEDIMGYQILRYLIWLVAFCSLGFNASVFIVHFSIFKRLTVPKFLQLNLALGDFSMGVYLAMLAYEDVSTAGDYFNHAIDWQQGFGCRVAGAVGIFAGQLSIYTLCVITLERFFTILWSIDLSMRLELGWAKGIMFVGWFYSISMALLPALGYANSYSKTSICLPLRNSNTADRAYIGALFFLVVSAFMALSICYLKMWKLVEKQKSNQAYNQERKVAKRMFTLVCVDFLCWGPIIFFGLTAIFGQPLITVTQSKILIVIFYPLNAVANPFLYVLLTRQYRKDVTYIRNRWNQWRKNLFKRDMDKDYSYNLDPYTTRYPVALNAHLGNVAAATGVADHLHHYKLPINYVNENGEKIELYKIGNGLMDDEDTRQDSADRSEQSKNELRANGTRDGACRARDGQYIIRHQIIPTKFAHVRTSSRMMRVACGQAPKDNKSRTHLVANNSKNNLKQEDAADEKRVKLGHVIDDNEQVSTLIDSDGFMIVKKDLKLTVANSTNKCNHNRHRHHSHGHHHHRRDNTTPTNDPSTTTTSEKENSGQSKNHLLVIDKPHGRHQRCHHKHNRHRHCSEKQTMACEANITDGQAKVKSRHVKCNGYSYESRKTTTTVTRMVVDETHDSKNMENISYRKYTSPLDLTPTTASPTEIADAEKRPEISANTTSATTTTSTSGASAGVDIKSTKALQQSFITNGLRSTMVCFCAIDNLNRLVALPTNPELSKSGKILEKDKRKHRCSRDHQHHRHRHHHHHHHHDLEHDDHTHRHAHKKHYCKSSDRQAAKSLISAHTGAKDVQQSQQEREFSEKEVIHGSI